MLGSGIAHLEQRFFIEIIENELLHISALGLGATNDEQHAIFIADAP